MGELCEKHGVSIHAILQTPITDEQDVPFVLQTESTMLSQIQGLCSDLEKLDFCECARERRYHKTLPACMR